MAVTNVDLAWNALSAWYEDFFYDEEVAAVVDFVRELEEQSMLYPARVQIRRDVLPVAPHRLQVMRMDHLDALQELHSYVLGAYIHFRYGKSAIYTDPEAKDVADIWAEQLYMAERPQHLVWIKMSAVNSAANMPRPKDTADLARLAFGILGRLHNQLYTVKEVEDVALTVRGILGETVWKTLEAFALMALDLKEKDHDALAAICEAYKDFLDELRQADNEQKQGQGGQSNQSEDQTEDQDKNSEGSEGQDGESQDGDGQEGQDGESQDGESGEGQDGESQDGQGEGMGEVQEAMQSSFGQMQSQSRAETRQAAPQLQQDHENWQEGFENGEFNERREEPDEAKGGWTERQEGGVTNMPDQEEDYNGQISDPTQQAGSVIRGGGGAAGAGRDILVNERLATGEERAQYLRLARKMREARWRERTTKKVPNEIPPGRLRVKGALQLSAEVAAGKLPQAKPWKQTKRKGVKMPTIRVGIVADSSVSMQGFEEDMAGAIWILTNAITANEGKVAAYAFGDSKRKLFAPPKPPKYVPVLKARGASDKVVESIKDIDYILNFDDADEGPRILALVSDGGRCDYGLMDQCDFCWPQGKKITRLFKKYRDEGVIVMQIGLKEEPHDNGAEHFITIDTIGEMADVIAPVCIQALKDAGYTD